MLRTDTFIIDPEETSGSVHAKDLTQEKAQKTADLLKRNNEKHHTFFTIESHMGVSISLAVRSAPIAEFIKIQVYLHNHIPHHAIVLWALGAKPETMVSKFERNTLYMRDALTQ